MGQPFPIPADIQGISRRYLPGRFRASPEGMALAEAGPICYANQAFAFLVGDALRKPPRTAISRFRPQGIRACCSPRKEGNRNHLCQFVSKRSDSTPSTDRVDLRSFPASARELPIAHYSGCNRARTRRMVRDGHERFRRFLKGRQWELCSAISRARFSRAIRWWNGCWAIRERNCGA